MTGNEAHQAVIEHLCGSPGTLAVSRTSPGGWHSGTVHDGLLSTADRESIVFVKERRGRRHWLSAVAYDDTAGCKHLDMVGTRQQTDGSWVVAGSAGGGDAEIPRDQPWVNFTGWWGQDFFCAGGRVSGRNAEQAQRVRLVFDDGYTVDDDIQQGLVLFIVEHAIPAPWDTTAQIVDAHGALLATHPFAWPRSPR